MPGVSTRHPVTRVRADLRDAVAPGEHEHRRPGPRDDGGVARGPQPVDEVHRPGVRAAPRLLVQPVAGGGEQVLGRGAEGVHEEGGARRVGRGVGEAHLQRQHRAGLGGRQLRVGGEHHRLDVGVHGQVHGRGAGALVVGPRQGHPAVHARRRVVGVALEARREAVGEREVDVVPGPSAGEVVQGLRGDDAGDDGRRRRAHPPPVRHLVATVERQALRRLDAELGPGDLHGPVHEVGGVERHRTGTFTGDRDHEPGLPGHGGAAGVPHAEGAADRVEPRAEVGAARGHADLDVVADAQLLPAHVTPRGRGPPRR